MTASDLLALAGRDLGVTGWLEVTSSMVRRFAELTGDHQWIHLDADRAAAGPFGRPVAHGLLTLSLVGGLLPQLFVPPPGHVVVNEGLAQVRFVTPVPVGSRVRLGAVIRSVDQLGPGARLHLALRFELLGQRVPACLALLRARCVPPAP